MLVNKIIAKFLCHSYYVHVVCACVDVSLVPAACKDVSSWHLLQGFIVTLNSVYWLGIRCQQPVKMCHLLSGGLYIGATLNSVCACVLALPVKMCHLLSGGLYISSCTLQGFMLL